MKYAYISTVLFLFGNIFVLNSLHISCFTLNWKRKRQTCFYLCCNLSCLHLHLFVLILHDILGLCGFCNDAIIA